MAEYACGNIYIREGRMEKAGDLVAGHGHNFDHTTYCARGAIRVESLNDDGSVKDSTELRADEAIKSWALIKRGVLHRLTALQDGSLYHCIYAHRTPQGDIVQEYTGWAPAYW